MVYEAALVGYLRATSHLFLVGTRTDDNECFNTMDRILALGARCVGSMTSTANARACIVEAGFDISATMAARQRITRLVQLRASPLKDTSLHQAAIKALGEMDHEPSEEVLVDRATDTPHKTQYRRHIRIHWEPEHTPEERRMLKSGIEAEITKAKQAANKRRLAACPRTAWRVFVDGSVVRLKGRPSRAAGAATLYPPGDGRYDWYKLKGAGEEVSSFTAEGCGLECGLSLIENRQPPQGSCIWIFTDSQSTLSALNKGVRRQTDARLAKAWKRMLAIAERGHMLFLNFVYSHVGNPEMDDVDGIARKAAERRLDSDGPKHVRDVIRPLKEAVRKRNVTPGTLRHGAGINGSPTRWSIKEHAYLSNKGCILLCQLRTDACPAIGGHLIGPYRCHRCGGCTHRPRGDATESMVQHAFHCPQGLRLRRALRIRGLKDLWLRPMTALSYIESFKITNQEATNTAQHG